MRLMRLAAGLLIVQALGGCALLLAPPYSADYEALDRLKKAPASKLAVGTVQPRDPNATVNKISLRGASFRASKGTFAQYLEDALIQDLREISLYDPDAKTRIEATLLKNDIDVSGLVSGTGTIEVELTVVRNGTAALKKVYAASTGFESSFAGAVAIPKGQSEYGNLVRAVLARIYGDADFINAIKP